MISCNNGDLVSYECHQGLLLPVHEMCHETRVKDISFEDRVEDIRICKLPYQDHPFVHGSIAGKDVWLKDDGSWTESDEEECLDIPLYKGLRIMGVDIQTKD